MSQFLANLTGDGGLLRVRAGLTLALVGGFVWGFTDGIVSSEVFVPVVMSAVAYYFGQRSASPTA